MARQVLIIDGNPAIRRGLRALLAELSDVSVAGMADRGDCALRLALTASPDIALVDADLLGLCGLAPIRLLRAGLPRTRVVALVIYPERRTLAVRAGAHAFVLNDARFESHRVRRTRAAPIRAPGAAAHRGERQPDRGPRAGRARSLAGSASRGR